MTQARLLAASMQLLLALGLTAAGCSRGPSSGSNLGNGKNLDPGDVSYRRIEKSARPVDSIVEACLLPLAEALYRRSPANFSDPRLRTSATITTTGNATSGTIDVDFGSGTEIDRTVYTGSVSATFTETGAGAFTLDVTLNNVEGQHPEIGSANHPNGTALTLAVTHSGDAAVIRMVGDFEYHSGASSWTANVDLTFDYDASADQFVISGQASVTSDQGETRDMTSSGLTVDLAAGGVVAGTLNVQTAGGDDIYGALTWTEFRTVDYDCHVTLSDGTRKHEQGSGSVRRL
jgi:hypothetical protein